MGKIHTETLQITGIFDLDSMAIEINGTTRLLKDLLVEWDGCDITIRATKEIK